MKEKHTLLRDVWRRVGGLKLMVRDKERREKEGGRRGRRKTTTTTRKLGPFVSGGGGKQELGSLDALDSLAKVALNTFE